MIEYFKSTSNSLALLESKSKGLPNKNTKSFNINIVPSIDFLILEYY